jgi:hypothetical protein
VVSQESFRHAEKDKGMKTARAMNGKRLEIRDVFMTKV